MTKKKGKIVKITLSSIRPEDAYKFLQEHKDEIAEMLKEPIKLPQRWQRLKTALGKIKKAEQTGTENSQMFAVRLQKIAMEALTKE